MIDYQSDIENLLKNLPVPKNFNQKKIISEVQNVYSEHDLNKIIPELIEDSLDKRLRAFKVIRSPDDKDSIPGIYLNITRQGTYVRPHLHNSPNLPVYETFGIVNEGKVRIIQFFEEGSIHEVGYISQNNPFFTTKPDYYHSFVIPKGIAVLIELNYSIFNPNSPKTFAQFAPEEKYENNVLNIPTQDYIQDLITKTNPKKTTNQNLFKTT